MTVLRKVLRFQSIDTRKHTLLWQAIERNRRDIVFAQQTMREEEERLAKKVFVETFEVLENQRRI